MKNCIICDKLFELINNHQICCSKECAVINRKAWHKKYAQSYQRKQYLNSERYKRLCRAKRKQYRLTDKYKQQRGSSEYKQSQKEYRKLYNTLEITKQNRKTYRQSNKFKEYEKEYSKSPQRKKYYKAWLKTPKGQHKILMCHLKRRERLMHCIHSFTREEWKHKCDICNGVCPKCFNFFDNYLHKLTLDHILSLYWASEYFKQTGKKFVYTINDIQPLCLSCNCKKQKKLIEEVKPKGLYSS